MEGLRGFWGCGLWLGDFQPLRDGETGNNLVRGVLGDITQLQSHAGWGMRSELEKGVDHLKGSVSFPPIARQNLLLLDKALRNTGGSACHVVWGWSLHVFMHIGKQWIIHQLSKTQPNVKQNDFAFFLQWKRVLNLFSLYKLVTVLTKETMAATSAPAAEKAMLHWLFEVTRWNSV